MKQAVLICLLLIYSLAAGVKICEIHADPLVSPESSGEFFEICNPGPLPFKDTLQILIDSVPVFSGYFELNPGAYQMICGPDSEYGSECLIPQIRKTLRNSGGHELILQGVERYDRVLSPAARAGISSERDLQKSGVEWILCDQTYSNGEKVTPGYGNPALDLSINNVYISSVQSVRQNQEILLSIQLACTAPPCPDTKVEIFSDNDLDGIPDSLIAETVAQGPLPFSLTLPTANANHALIIKIEDPRFPNDNQKSLPVVTGPGEILKITEIFPAPVDDQSEWIEIKNQSPHPVSLNSVRVGKREKAGALKESVILHPGQFAVLCQTGESCLSELPGTEPRRYELDSWPVLKNSGDTLVLFTPDGLTLDSVVYNSIRESEKGFSLVYSDTGWIYNSEGLRASPGFEARRKNQKNSVKIGRRVCSLQKKQHPQISGYLQASQSLEIRIFSEGGRSAEAYYHQQSGAFNWQPAMENLVPGVYILWYRFSDGKSGTSAWVVSP